MINCRNSKLKKSSIMIYANGTKILKSKIHKYIQNNSFRNSFRQLFYFIRAATIIAYIAMANCLIQVEQVESNGIILRPLGNVYAYQETWKIVMSFSKEKYLQEQMTIEKRLHELELLQNKLAKNENIDVIMEEIRKLIEAIREINKVITPEKIRQKRAIAPFFGTVLEWLFGNPDEDTTDEILNMIKANKQTIQNTDNTILNHTIFTEELLQNMEKRYNYTKKELEMLINEINTLIETQNINNNQQEIENKILLYTQTLSLSLMRYINFQNKMAQQILSNEITHLDPEIVPFSFLEPLLLEIQQTISSDKMLPWNLLAKDREISCYKAIPMKVHVTKNNIIITLSIPIIAKNKKLLFTAIPSPIIKENYLLYIQAEAPYIIINQAKTEISFLNENDEDNCWKLDHQNQICPENYPIYKKQAQNNFCELEILSQTATNNCIFKQLPKRDIFIKILNTNQYYFAVMKPTKAVSNCKAKTETIILNGTGILTISEGCNVYNEKFRMISQKESTVTTQNNYILSNFKPIDTVQNKEIHKYVMNSKELTEINNNFEDLKERIKYSKIEQTMKIKNNQIEKTTIFTKTHTGISLGTIIIVAIVVWYICRKN